MSVHEDYNVTVSESFNPWLKNSCLYRELRHNSSLFLEAVARKKSPIEEGVVKKEDEREMMSGKWNTETNKEETQ